MSLRWQNLNDHGTGWRHGRAWLYIRGRTVVRCSWNWWGLKGWFGAQLDTGGDENDATISVHLGVVSFWLGIEGLLPYHWLDRGWTRTTGAVFSPPDMLRIWLGCQDWISPPERGWTKAWMLGDVLFGRAKFSKREVSTRSVHFPMPEKSYEGTVAMELASWKRPRWPFTQRILRASVDIPGGIPVPGKGTTAYNCGPDAIYGMTCPARDVHEAVAKVVASAMRDRERYPL